MHATRSLWQAVRKAAGASGWDVYTALDMYTNAKGECFPDEQTIALDVELSVRQVHRIIDQLVAAKLVVKSKRTTSKGFFLGNLYYLPYHPTGQDIRQDIGPDTDVRSDKTQDRTQDETPVSYEVVVSNSEVQENKKPPLSPRATTTSRKKPSVSIPDTFTVTDSLRAWGAEQRMTPADLQSQVERFRNNAIQNDRRCVNWDMAFKNWMLKARDDFHNLPSQKAGATPLLPAAAEPFPEDGGLAEYRAYQQRENR